VKKRIILLGISMVFCLMGGCLEATPLNDREMDAVAEYTANLLLKYDKNYKTPLYYASSTEELEKMLTPTPMPTSTPTPTPTTAPEVTPVVAPDGTTVPENGSEMLTSTPIPTPTPLPYDAPETGEQLTEIIAVEDITVTCDNYYTVESVVSNEYFILTAKEGRQYAVVEFKLHNDTEEEIVFDASKKGLEYSIDINTGTVSRVSLSMLENDLQYMPITVPAKGTADAVLVFEIEASEIDTAHLVIENAEENAVFIKLQ